MVVEVKNCRSDCIFFTPLYLVFISFYSGLFTYHKINNENVEGNVRKDCQVSIYSILFVLLMFSYIINFMPVMILVLIPGIFNHDYYIHIFIAYVTILIPEYSDIMEY